MLDRRATETPNQKDATMSRRLTIRLCKYLAVLSIALGAALAYSRYTHPDLRDRSTDDLSREAIALNRDHLNEPFVLRLADLARQEQIANEVARRLPARILAWQAEDEEEALAATAQARQPDWVLMPQVEAR
jgi:hypothetical protein